MAASAVAVLGLGCGQMHAAAQTGYLEGRLTVGPLAPVEGQPAGAERSVPPETYTSRALLVLKDGILVTRVTPDGTGRFRVALPPGTYTLTNAPLPNGWLERSDGPKSFEIEPGRTTTVTLSVDTGMR